MTNFLCPDAFVSPLVIEDAVTRALDEDFGRAGDVTPIATVPAGTRGRAVVKARQTGTIAGLPLVAAAFRKLDPSIEISGHAMDGASVQRGAALMTVAGDARAILGA